MRAPSFGIVHAHFAWSSLTSSCIQWLTRSRFLFFIPAEWKVYANHIFNVLEDGGGAVEALAGGLGLTESWREKYDKKRFWGVVVEVKPLTDAERDIIDDVACDHLGRRYDHVAIAKQALDGIVSQVIGRDFYWFRKFSIKGWDREDRWHICSWLATWTHFKAGWFFHRPVFKVVRESHGAIMRAKKVLCGSTPMKEDDFPRVTPGDIEEDVFRLRPQLYRIREEFGLRPRDLPICYISKIEAEADSLCGLPAPASMSKKSLT